ncbi:ACT domain-containing protein [soil metagenome]
MKKEFNITLQTTNDLLAVCRLSPAKTLPEWLDFEQYKFISITQTSDELSIVYDQERVPSDVKAEKNWRAIRIKGQLDFALVGILTRVITPLAENGISVYTISTYDTDYILVKDEQFINAIDLLRKHFTIEALIEF